MTKSLKGGRFEREICTRLSLWWTKDEDTPRDDVFWRTSQSGGRATTRSKKGKNTRYQQGDVTAVDPVGQPFIDFFTLELKRGYSKDTFADLLDKPNGPCTYRQWIEKIRETARKADSESWMLVVRRDKRIPLVVMDFSVGLSVGMAVDCFVRIFVKGIKVSVYTLDTFFKKADPERIKTMIKDRRTGA